MLIQFNGENFKSYKNDFSLDLTATSIKEHPENTIQGKKNEKYLKTCAIYGANSSGKSNIIEAFEYMQSLVINSFSEASKRNFIPLKRFKFSEKSKINPSKFEVFFEKNENEYQYGFIVNSEKVIEEWLYKRDFRGKEKYNLIFERTSQKFDLNKKLKTFKEMLGGVSERTLLLSFLSNILYEETKIVYEWFLETEIINFGNPFFDMMNSNSLPKACLDDSRENEKRKFKNYLKSIDVGIESIRVEEISSDDSESPKFRAFANHINNDTGKLEEIILGEESSGTLKMISLYDDIMHALSNGLTLFVDELDAKLHPLLTKYIIQLFHNEEINKNNAQLIFSTHDTNNLTKNIFRRDQIWFVEKNEESSSNLYSLAEYKCNDKKIRNDASYNKDYLGGRYGAIPILKEFNVLEE